MLATSYYATNSDRSIELWHLMNGTGQYIQTCKSMKFGRIRTEAVTALLSNYFSCKIMVWHFALISPVSRSPPSLLTLYCVGDCWHCAHALVSAGNGAHVLTLLLSRKSLCYLLKWLQHSSSRTIHSSGRQATHKAGLTFSFAVLAIVFLFCFSVSDLQCANISSLNTVQGKHSCICVCLCIVFLTVYVWVKDCKSNCEKEKHNDNAAYSDNILRH